MTITPSILCPETVLTTSAVTMATGPAGGWALLKRGVFSAYKANAANVTIKIYRVVSGGTAGATNILTDTLTLTPGQVYVAAELANMVLNPGDTVQALCSSATSVNCTISGFTGP